MPVLSQFYGIIIRMYFLQSEHNPPHIHAIACASQEHLNGDLEDTRIQEDTAA